MTNVIHTIQKEITSCIKFNTKTASFSIKRLKNIFPIDMMLRTINQNIDHFVSSSEENESVSYEEDDDHDCLL